MSEELKALIEKIQQEGVGAAEEKAREIEELARKNCRLMIEEAKKEAQGILAEARTRAAEAQASAKASMQQAGRDFLIALKEEIYSILHKVVLLKSREALKPGALIELIAGLIKKQHGCPEGEIVVTLPKAELKEVKDGLFKELEAQLKKGILLQASDEVKAGFTISFDAGKSQFEFTDRSLAEYISKCLRPDLAEILES